MGSMNLHTVIACLLGSGSSVAKLTHDVLHLFRTQLVYRPVNNGRLHHHQCPMLMNGIGQSSVSADESVIVEFHTPAISASCSTTEVSPVTIPAAPPSASFS